MANASKRWQHRLAHWAGLLCIAFVLVPVASSHASLIAVDFTISVLAGTLAGNNYTGELSYEGSLVEPPIDVDGILVTTIDAGQQLRVGFEFNGNNYSEASATNLSGPLLQLANGSPNGPQFGGLFWILLQPPDLFQFSGDVLLILEGPSSGSATVAYSEPRMIPEPSSFDMAVLAGIGWALLRLLQKHKPRAAVKRLNFRNNPIMRLTRYAADARCETAALRGQSRRGGVSQSPGFHATQP